MAVVFLSHRSVDSYHAYDYICHGSMLLSKSVLYDMHACIYLYVCTCVKSDTFWMNNFHPHCQSLSFIVTYFEIWCNVTFADIQRQLKFMKLLHDIPSIIVFSSMVSRGFSSMLESASCAKVMLLQLRMHWSDTRLAVSLTIQSFLHKIM